MGFLKNVFGHETGLDLGLILWGSRAVLPRVLFRPRLSWEVGFLKNLFGHETGLDLGLAFLGSRAVLPKVLFRQAKQQLGQGEGITLVKYHGCC